MQFKINQLIAALFATSAIALAMPTLPAAAHTQEQPHDEAAIENAPADTDEPSLDDLLGLDDADAEDKPADDQNTPEDQADPKPVDPDADPADGDDHNHEADPELTRDLDRRLSGQEAATQFAQAIEEMAEVAIRLDEENDPGIDTQRMQDEIILKLEQIIASAEKTQQQQQQQQQGQPKPGQPRQADQGGQPKPGQKPGDKPGEKPGDKPGEKPGQKPGDKPGDQNGEQPGQKPGDKQGQQQGDQRNPDGTESGNNASQGSVKNEQLSMKELREGEWGNLPPRLRDELAESLSESFNPVYRAATEAFYRRIAELSQQEAEGDE